MDFAPSFFEHLSDRLQLAVYDTNQEYRMSVQHVRGLADIVRQTRQALADATAAAGEMQVTAGSVAAKVQTVRDMTDELKSADAELGAAIGQMSNGGPPLDSTAGSAPNTPPFSPVPGLNEAGVKP